MAEGKAPSVAVFCPQSLAPSESYLDHLHVYVKSHANLQPLVYAITTSLDRAWSIFSAQDPAIAALTQGPGFIRILVDWIVHGNSSAVAKAESGILALPLLVAVQVIQYFQYLEVTGLTHAEFIENVRHGKGGLQGYCGGLPAAIAIACSKDESQVIEKAGVAMCIALGVGAYGELGYDPAILGSTNMALRLRFEGQGDELTAKFPGTHISAITDPKTVSIVGPVHVLSKLKAHAESQGLLVQNMHIRGKVHNPENAQLAKQLFDICSREPSLILGDANDLQVPIRSNRTGDLIAQGSLTLEIVQTILASRCEWYMLLTNLANDMSRSTREKHTLVTFGIGDCVPLVPFHHKQVSIKKLSALSLIEQVLDQPSVPENAIAIVGASCRLPGANNLDELWQLISQSRDQHGELPTSRFNLGESFRASQSGRFVNDRKFFANLVDDIDKFDADFFGHGRKEALNMDPQQRLLLEIAYEAMESSGYMSKHRREDGDKVGCFIGGSLVEYLDNTSAHAPTAYTATGTIRAFLCGRINHYFGWTGPSEVIDSACSSSLVAINRAVKALQAGECNMALAGGINLITSFNNFMDLAKAGFLSRTGQCKPFDVGADGYCRSDGAGLVVLKPWAAARKDGDMILGVIPAVATNNGGTSNAITIPHSPSLQQLFKDVLQQANLSHERITYVEAHGTGTQAGDPVEIESIRAVFGGASRPRPLSVGSLKGNIGHCETAAGVASLLKVLAMLKHQALPPLASHKELNPKIAPLEADKMTITRRLSPWNAPWRAACVNSYGAAGTNCALICMENPEMEERLPWPCAPPTLNLKRPVIISAASRKGLLTFTEKLGSYLLDAQPPFDDVCLTLNKHRGRHKYFSVLKASSSVDLGSQLTRQPLTIQEAKNDAGPNIVLVLSGQSKTYAGLDERLYQSFPGFRAYVDTCDEILQSLGYPSIFPAIFSSSYTENVLVLQSALFTIQYACARSWMDAGLRVDAILGHSLGELAALACSGVLSLEDCMKLIACRAQLMQTKWGPEKGAMLVVFAEVEIVQLLMQHVDKDLEIACYNASNSHVIAGSAAAITLAEEAIRTEQRFAQVQVQRLDTSFGFHCKFTEPILDELTATSATLNWKKPLIPLETCTAIQIDEVQYDRPARHARDPVYFADAVNRIEQRLGSCIWLEAGFDTPIVPMVKRALKTPQKHTLQSVSTRNAPTPADVITRVSTNLLQSGAVCTYWNFQSVSTPRQVWLPPYQFERVSHWLDHVDRASENLLKASESTQTSPETPLFTPPMLVCRRDASQLASSSSFTISTACERFQKIVGGHNLRGNPLCPASLYMECAAMALQLLQPGASIEGISFSELDFQAALGLGPDKDVVLTLNELVAGTTWSFAVKSFSTLDPRHRETGHCSGKVHLSRSLNFDLIKRLVLENIAGIEKRPGVDTLQSRRAYGLFMHIVDYAPFFRAISKISLDDKQALAYIQSPKDQPARNETTVSNQCDAVTLDACIQVVGLLINSHEMLASDEVMVSAGIGEAFVAPGVDLSNHDAVWKVYSRFSPVDESNVIGDVFALSSASGGLAVAMVGCKFHKMHISKLEKIVALANSNSQSIVNVQDAPRVEAPPSRSQPPAPIRPAQVAKEDTVVEVLRAMIVSYSGMSASAITDELCVADMGIDSLAAVGMADEIWSKFEQTITSEQLLGSTFYGLCQLLSNSTVTPARAAPEAAPLATMGKRFNGKIDAPPPLPTEALEAFKSQSDGNAQRYSEMLRILSESTGLSVDNINAEIDLNSAQLDLADLGVDSLCRIEMNDELERAFGVKLEENGPISLLSTVNALMGALNIEKPPPQPESTLSTSNPPTLSTASSPTFDDDMDGASKAVSDSGKLFGDSAVPTALAKAEASFGRVAAEQGFTDYWTQVEPLQSKLLIAYIVEAFFSLGVDLRNTAQGTAVPQIKHLPKYTRLMDRLFTILEQHQIVEQKDNVRYRGHGSISTLSSNHILTEFQRKYPAYRVESDLMALTGPKLGSCLVGTADPIAVLFGNVAGLEVMEQIYFRAPMFATLTEQLVVFLESLIEGSTALSRGSPIRIMEVGAGFGGTTTRVAEALNALNVQVEYTFTDISRRLVQNAKQKFSRYNWMQYKTFNLEHEVPAMLQDQFDIVICTNCVHATTSKVTSCERIRQLLRPNGIMVLSEVTRVMDWYDITFGLLDGWWLAENGKEYPLQPVDNWTASFKTAGFATSIYSAGPLAEQNTQRLLVASTVPLVIPDARPDVETMIYKEVDGVSIEADVYLPDSNVTDAAPMPVALMIHGGGHMTLSRKAIRPLQTAHLLNQGVLPVSIDYRLCPEVNLIDGPMADVRDAYIWVKTQLPQILRRRGILVDGSRVGVVGWSTGGHLAMTLGWTVRQYGLEPPATVISFYAPTDFSSRELDVRRAEMLPERRLSLESIIKSLPSKPITSYDHNGGDATNLGFVVPGDPRSELVLSLFKEGNGLPLLLCGLSKSSEDGWFGTPSEELVATIDPMAQLRAGNYTTPTYILHGKEDEIVPFGTAEAFVRELQTQGVSHGFLPVERAKHIYDLALRPGMRLWEERVGPAYDFFLSILKS